MTDIASLTRDEAAQRAALIDVERYDVHIDLRGLYEGGLWAATSTVSFGCREPGASTFVDCIGDVSSVTLNGEALDASSAERGRIPLPNLRADNVLVVSHTQSDTSSGTAILKTVDSLDKLVYVWSTFEPDRARYAFACFDQPDLKAPHGFVVDAHETWTVTSNSAPDLVEDLDGDRERSPLDVRRHPEAVDVRHGGQRRAVPRDPLLARRIRPRSVRPAVARQFLERDAEELFDLTDRGLAFFGERFGQPFAQERYDQVFVPNMGGAMENWGSVTWTDSVLYRSTPTYGQRAVRAQILLHEMAHMWFGDLVTMRWWDDLWLNEAFAVVGVELGRRELHRVHRRVGDLPGRRQDAGVPPGPLPRHAPDPRRRPERRAGDGQLRRDHLHQGRERAQAADGVRRRGRVRRGRSAPTSATTRGATRCSTT